MFNLSSFENITNKVATFNEADVKVFAGNKIRLGKKATDTLNLVEGRNVIILKSAEGQVVIASTDAETKQGRPINKNREFSHGNIADSLNGHHSEWSIQGEGQEFNGDTYFELVETVHGPNVVAELEAAVEAREEHEAEIAGTVEAPAAEHEGTGVEVEAQNRADILDSMEDEEEMEVVFNDEGVVTNVVTEEF